MKRNPISERKNGFRINVVRPYPLKVIYRLDLEEAEYSRIGELPIMPTLGLMIDVGDGTYRKIEDVFYQTETGYLEVFLDEAMDENLIAKIKNGWTKEG